MNEQTKGLNGKLEARAHTKKTKKKKKKKNKNKKTKQKKKQTTNRTMTVPTKNKFCKPYVKTFASSFHSSGLVWTGLIIADENDACSYRWSYDCKIPDWVVFKDRPNTGRCGAIDIDIGLSHVMISCDEKLQFICEHDTGGKITVAMSNKQQTNKFRYRKWALYILCFQRQPFRFSFYFFAAGVEFWVAAVKRHPRTSP